MSTKRLRSFDSYSQPRYFSMDQVREIFHRLDVHEDMLVAKDFQRLLLNVHAYMPGKAWPIPKP